MKKFIKRHRSIFMLAPGLILILSLSAAAVINTLLEGLGYLPELNMYEINVEWFAELFNKNTFWQSLTLCFRTALISTLLSLFFGIILAYVVGDLGSKWVPGLLRLPVILSYVAAALLIYNTVSTHGLIYHLVKLTGIQWDGPQLAFQSSGEAVIILYLYKGVPFIAMSLSPVFGRAIQKYRNTAYNLGAGKIKTFFHVILPTGYRTLLTGALVLFNYEMFSYEGFYYLGSARPASLGVLALQTYQKSDLRFRSEGMAINAVMIFISLITAAAYILCVRKEAKTCE